MSVIMIRIPCFASIIIPDYRIEGFIHLYPMMRFSDFINAAPEFIPITEAKIYSIYDNKLQTQSPLIEVKRDQIIMIFPAEAKSVMTELEDVVESKEGYSGKPLEGSFYIDPFKKQS